MKFTLRLQNYGFVFFLFVSYEEVRRASANLANLAYHLRSDADHISSHQVVDVRHLRLLPRFRPQLRRDVLLRDVATVCYGVRDRFLDSQSFHAANIIKLYETANYFFIPPRPGPGHRTRNRGNIHRMQFQHPIPRRPRNISCNAHRYSTYLFQIKIPFHCFLELVQRTIDKVIPTHSLYIPLKSNLRFALAAVLVSSLRFGTAEVVISFR